VPPTDLPADLASRPIVFFDGTCNFCDRSVQFILGHERDHDLMFVAIQSPRTGAIIASALGEPRTGERLRDLIGADGTPTTLALLQGDELYTASTAALLIASHLRAPWRWLRLFAVVPRSIRDPLYRWFARHRYQWFGRTDACRVPSATERDRFVT
jgi:predicted DCC family thiol-disulfide oxidoreductase YuxK